MSSAGKVRQGGVFVEIGADAKAFFATLSKVNAQIGKAGKAMAMMGARMTAVGTTITAPIAAAAAVFSKVGDSVQKMAIRTGLSTEAVSGLAFAAEQSGTDIATLEKGIRTMQRTLDEAATKGGAAAEAFQRLGLDVAKLSQMSPEQQFMAMADALAAVQDPGERAALAMKVFGKAGASLVPLVAGGAAGINELTAEAQRLGLIMDKETADSAAALTDAMNAMGKAIRAIVVNVGGAVAPMFTKLARIVSVLAGDFSKFIKENGRLVQIALAVGAGITALGVALTTAGFAAMGMSAGLAAIGGVLAALASPLALLVGGLAAVVAFGPQIASGLSSAFGSAGALIGNTANTIAGPLRKAVADASIVFSDLGKTASTTFSGIYDAISEGDLSGAMDILWAGLQAGWLRGVEALMGAVDPWISLFQNTFTYLGTAIASTWDGMWTGVSNSFNTFGAYLQGAFDNVINGVLAAWDTLEAGIRKSWNYVQSFFKKGFNLKKENEKVDNQMDARRRKRELERPGIEGRTKKADEENRQATKESDQRRKAMDDAADATAAGRLQRNEDRAAARREGTVAAESRLNTLTRDASDRRVFRGQADEVIDSVTKAKTMDELRDLSDQFHALAATGKLSEAQTKRYAEAVDMATDAIEDRGAATGPAPIDPDALKRAAMDAAASQAEVAGTFSAAAVGGMGLGQSLQQKQVDLLGKIEANTRENEGGLVND